MAHFFRYETVELPLKLNRDGVLEDYEEVVVTLKQPGLIISKKTPDDLGIDVENNIVNLYLTQEETASFYPTLTQIQVNILYTNGERDTSEVAIIKVEENLHEAVMPDE